MTDAHTVLERAVSMAGRRTIYWAGAGGTDPHALTPFQALPIGAQWPHLSAQEQAQFAPLAEAAGLDVDDPRLVAPACDCSGFVCWALGISRHPDDHTWINTDTIWDDARGRNVQFRKLAQAAVGCLVVYPKPPLPSHEKYGHVALVTAVDAHGKATQIVHCSADNFRNAPHDAIKLTTPDPFETHHQSIYAWFLGMNT